MKCIFVLEGLSLTSWAGKQMTTECQGSLVEGTEQHGGGNSVWTGGDVPDSALLGDTRKLVCWIRDKEGISAEGVHVLKHATLLRTDC